MQGIHDTPIDRFLHSVVFIVQAAAIHSLGHDLCTLLHVNPAFYITWNGKWVSDFFELSDNNEWRWWVLTIPAYWWTHCSSHSLLLLLFVLLWFYHHQLFPQLLPNIRPGAWRQSRKPGREDWECLWGIWGQWGWYIGVMFPRVQVPAYLGCRR